MISAVTSTAQPNPATASATQAQPAAKGAAPSQKAAPPSTSSTSANVTDSVQISNAARAMMQEATELPSQTAVEASKGDRQAQRLLAREAAEKKME